MNQSEVGDLVEEGQEFLRVDLVRKVEPLDVGHHVDQILLGIDDSGPVLLAQVANVLVEGLHIELVGCFELPSQDIVIVVQPLQNVGSMRHVDDAFQLERHLFVDTIEVDLHFHLLVSGQKPHPIRLFFMFDFMVLVAISAADDCHQLFSVGVLWWLHLGRIGERVRHHWDLAGHSGEGSSGLLSFPLIPELVVDIWVEPGQLVSINQQSDFTSTISQAVLLVSQPVTCPESLCDGFILNSHIDLGSRELVLPDFKVPDESELTEQMVQVMVVDKLRVIFDRSVHHRYQHLPYLVIGMVRHHVPSFEVVCEEDLEVGVMDGVQCSVDAVVIGTSI